MIHKMETFAGTTISFHYQKFWTLALPKIFDLIKDTATPAGTNLQHVANSLTLKAFWHTLASNLCKLLNEIFKEGIVSF